MKVLRGVFGVVYGAAFIANGILFLWVEWTFLRQSFLQMLNPFLHFQVVLTLLTMPLFWVLTVVTIGAYFAMVGAQKHIDEGL
jgi:hypothetical protein